MTEFSDHIIIRLILINAQSFTYFRVLLVRWNLLAWDSVFDSLQLMASSSLTASLCSSSAVSGSGLLLTFHHGLRYVAMLLLVLLTAIENVVLVLKGYHPICTFDGIWQRAIFFFDVCFIPFCPWTNTLSLEFGPLCKLSNWPCVVVLLLLWRLMGFHTSNKIKSGV